MDMDMEVSLIHHGLAKVMSKLFTYLRHQRIALVKHNIVSGEMDEAFQDLMMEMNEYLFTEIQDRPILKNQHASCANMFEQPLSEEEGFNNAVPKSIEILMTEEPQQDHECMKCFEIFKSIRELQNHMKNAHDDFMKEGEFECVHCGILLSSIGDLKKHEDSHKNIKPKNKMTSTKRKSKKITKKKSEKSEKKKETLKQALLRDLSPEKLNNYIDNLQPEDCCNGPDRANPYLCKFCKTGTSTFPSLIQHLIKHSNTKIFKCTYCNLRFQSSVALTYHVKSLHLKIKAYDCDICKKKFTLLGTLKEHMLIHSGEKPYACDVCGIHFASRSHRSRHKRKEHADKSNSYSCSICSVEFTDETTFHEHILQHAASEPSSLMQEENDPPDTHKKSGIETE